jgi:hypothetical protein
LHEKNPTQTLLQPEENLSLQHVMEHTQKYDGANQQQGKPELTGLPAYGMEARQQGKGEENIRENIRPDARTNPFIQERAQTNHHHQRQQKKSKPA